MTAAIPAATVIVVRDGDDGLETLMLRRNPHGAFGGMWVFPGGRVDPGDHPVDHRVDDALDDPSAAPSALAAAGRELAAAANAAVREAREEAGIDLAPADVVPFAHWLPPTSVPKRFATWFFVAAATDGEVTVDGSEIHDHGWLRPVDALEHHRRGELDLAPPTWVTLYELADHPDVGSLLDHARRREPEHYLTRPLVVDGPPVLTWHGDAAYDDAPGATDPSGPRHRLVMTPGDWQYERTT